MSWTYTNDPASVPLDTLRFTIGDTDTTDQQLSDEELQYLLDTYTTPLSAATAAVRGLIAKYSRRVDKAVGDLKISYSQQLENYITLLSTLGSSADVSLAPPFAGGISISDKLNTESDTDRVAPHFRIGMHDIPGK